MTESEASAVAMCDIPKLRSAARKAGESATVEILDRRRAYLDRRNRLQRDHMQSNPHVMALSVADRRKLWESIGLPERGMA